MCTCASLPSLLYVDDPQLFEDMEPLDAAPWRELRRCRRCGQLWRLDAPDRLQVQFAAKLSSREMWIDFDATAQAKALLLDSRGGTSREECIVAGCVALAVRGSAHCVDHLYEQGHRR